MKAREPRGTPEQVSLVLAVRSRHVAGAAPNAFLKARETATSES